MSVSSLYVPDIWLVCSYDLWQVDRVTSWLVKQSNSINFQQTLIISLLALNAGISKDIRSTHHTVNSSHWFFCDKLTVRWRCMFILCGLVIHGTVWHTADFQTIPNDSIARPMWGWARHRCFDLMYFKLNKWNFNDIGLVISPIITKSD